MADKRRASHARFKGRFQAIRFNAQTALSTLADAAVLQTVLTSLAQDFYAVSADVFIGFRGATALEGPITFGFNNGDLSVTEVTETLDATVTSESDIIAKERLRRPVRRIGKVSDMHAGGGEGFNDGKAKRVKLHFNLANSIQIEGWVRNQSGAALTTGAIVEWQGTIYGYWR